jgi:hypothetical protein
MESVKEQFTTRRRALIILVVYAVVVGGVTFMVNAGAAAGGEAQAMSRAILGLVGVAGGVFAWTLRAGPISGWHVLMAWALVQIPVFAWSPAGSPTLQIVALPLGMTSSVEVNGVLTSYSEIGVNLVGVVLAAVLSKQRMAFTGKRVAIPV